MLGGGGSLVGGRTKWRKGGGQREGARGSETEEQRCEADGVTGTDITRGWREGTVRAVDEKRGTGERHGGGTNT